MSKRCPTCGGAGTVDKVFPPGVYGFGQWPRETCMTCCGSGWYSETEQFVREVVPQQLPSFVPPSTGALRLTIPTQNAQAYYQVWC